jgi:FlaA1/EpsC-like NDP-sugar epimerase
MQYKGQNILIIGGTGTIGSKLVEELLKQEPNVIRVFSRDEHKQFLMAEAMRSNKNIRFLIGDVRDSERLYRAMENIDIVFHTAAMKHVPACEYNPDEAVKTNVLGTQNVINAAISQNISRVVFTSSDKSISPTNAMGATKLLAERLIAAADYRRGNAKTIFSAVRFGNVMGSRGSVIPLFIQQIMDKRRITVTDPMMTRFMMTISQAVQLTMKAVEVATGGEIFVLKMPVLKLGDMVQVVIEETCTKQGISPQEVIIDQIGLRPGEKMYEELMTSEEAVSAYDLGPMFAVTQPFNKEKYDIEYQGKTRAALRSYTSEDQIPLTKEEIRELIKSADVIFDRRKI